MAMTEEERKEKARKCFSVAKDTLSDSYVRSLIARCEPFGAADVTQDLIELKRINLKMTRMLASPDIVSNEDRKERKRENCRRHRLKKKGDPDYQEKIRRKTREYREANPEKVKGYNQKHYIKHKDAVDARNAKYRSENKAKIAENDKKYRASNRGKIRKIKKAWEAKNRAKVNASSRDTSRAATQSMNDTYIKRLLARVYVEGSEHSLAFESIPQDLVELKRINLQITRILKERKQK